MIDNYDARKKAKNQFWTGVKTGYDFSGFNQVRPIDETISAENQKQQRLAKSLSKISEKLHEKLRENVLSKDSEIYLPSVKLTKIKVPQIIIKPAQVAKIDETKNSYILQGVSYGSKYKIVEWEKNVPVMRYNCNQKIILKSMKNSNWNLASTIDIANTILFLYENQHLPKAKEINYEIFTSDLTRTILSSTRINYLSKSRTDKLIYNYCNGGNSQVRFEPLKGSSGLLKKLYGAKNINKALFEFHKMKTIDDIFSFAINGSAKVETQIYFFRPIDQTQDDSVPVVFKTVNGNLKIFADVKRQGIARKFRIL